MVRLRRLAPIVAFVSLGILLPAQTTYTWTGNAVTRQYGSATANASNVLNWDSAPVSSGTTTQLLFAGSNGLGGSSYLQVTVPSSFEAFGITVSSQSPHYGFEINDGGTFGLGAGGFNLTNTSGYGVDFGNGTLQLLASQTWTVESVLNVDAAITGPSAYTLTKAGIGTLTLAGPNSTFSGGLTLQNGELVLGTSSTWDATLSTITRGPVGTGRLTLGTGTTLTADSSDGNGVRLHNPITLGNHVTVGSGNKDGRFTLAGDITPTSTNTTVELSSDGALFIEGAIGNVASGDATSLTFARPGGEARITASIVSSSDYFPVAVLSGNNTYTGATTVDQAGVIFYTSGSLGSTSSIQALNGGYVGTGYNGGMAAILGKISSASTFDGALGFDTDPDQSSAPTTFADTLNLSAFANDNGGPDSGFWGLGSMTSATLTGTITPPSGGNYVFGGGSGKLYVQSNLGVPSNSTAAGVRVRTPYGDNPLAVWLQGNNSYAGKLLSDHSIVVLDSANALPALSGSNSDTGRFQMDSGAYVGYTENTGLTAAQFLARFVTTGDHSASVLGFDSATTAGRTIADAIDLTTLHDATNTAYTGNIFLGTTTHVHLTSDAIKAPVTGMLSVTGVSGGWLTLDGKLQAANLTSLFVGTSGNDSLERGYVEITNTLNNYTGGTELKSGYLVLGGSSTVSAGAITQGPLGTGRLEIEGYAWNNTPALVASATNVTLHNDLSFDSYTALQLGVPVTTDTESAAYKAQAYTGHGLTLAGAISGDHADLSVRGNATFTLSGNNSGLTNSWIYVGNYTAAEGTPLVVANSNTALGATSNSIYLLAGADLQFTTAAPSVGSLSGGYTYSSDPNASFIALAADSNLTINQASDGYLHANIGGAPADFSGNTTAAVNASLTKNGNGSLHLFGNNTYSGGTTINAGTIIAGSSVQRDGLNNIVSGPLGTGTITLNGGGVGTESGITLENPITFGANGGTLAGNGAFNTHFTIGTNIKLAPGASPGVLTFTNGLTLATGGTLSIDIANLLGTAGSDYDQVKITAGTFAVTAADAGFSIQLNSLTSTYGGYGPLATDFSTPASLTIIDSVTPLSLADLAKFSLNTTNFTTYQPGDFSLSLSADSTDLILNFTPVPEPSTYALLGVGLLLVGYTVRRQRRR